MVMRGLLGPGRGTAPQSLILNRSLKMTALVHELMPSDRVLSPRLNRLQLHEELLDYGVFLHRLLVARLVQLGHGWAPWHACRPEASLHPYRMQGACGALPSSGCSEATALDT